LLGFAGTSLQSSCSGSSRGSNGSLDGVEIALSRSLLQCTGDRRGESCQQISGSRESVDLDHDSTVSHLPHTEAFLTLLGVFRERPVRE
jgi:hypothetical protein